MLRAIPRAGCSQNLDMGGEKFSMLTSWPQRSGLWPGPPWPPVPWAWIELWELLCRLRVRAELQGAAGALGDVKEQPGKPRKELPVPQQTPPVPRMNRQEHQRPAHDRARGTRSSLVSLQPSQESCSSSQLSQGVREMQFH